MLDNIPITILTTTYNCGPYIAASIRSILNQSYKNIELLIIDDGSSDMTSDIIRSINSDTIRYLRLDHIGRSAALNYGLKEARYDWVALMDADDIAAPDRLEKEIRLVNSDNNVIIFSDSVYFKRGKIQFLNKINTEKEDLKKKIEFRGHICNSSVLYNRHFIMDNGGYNVNLDHSEDWDLWIRLLNKANFVQLNEMLIFMRIRDNSLSKKGTKRPDNISSIREYLFKKKVKLKVKYFFWKLWNFKTHFELTRKLAELDQTGTVLQ